MASLQLCHTFSPTSPLKHRPVQCANERQVLFSRIAHVYDNLNDLLSLGSIEYGNEWLYPGVEQKLETMLDVCCGSGDLAFLLSEKVGPGGKVIGLDFSKDQLSLASYRQDLLLKACYKNIDWVEGDALDLPFSDCFFDAITMGYDRLRNVVDKPKALQEMFRVVKFHEEWMIDNVVVPVATGYGHIREYQYFKSSIKEVFTGKDLEKLALEVGFSRAKHYEISGGLMG